MITFDFLAVLAEWPLLVRGVLWTLGLTAVAATIGVTLGVAKGEDKLKTKVNEIIAAAKASGELNKMAMKWLGRPLGDLPS